MDRTERFALKLCRAEKVALARLAEDEGGLSQAAMLRHLLRREARARGLWPPVTQHRNRSQSQEVAR
jgi:hypothetical protein